MNFLINKQAIMLKRKLIEHNQLHVDRNNDYMYIKERDSDDEESNVLATPLQPPASVSRTNQNARRN